MNVYSYDGVVPVIHPSAFVHPSAVIIGDVIIGPNVYVAPCASLRGDLGGIRVGEGANIQDSAVLHGFPGMDTVVGDNGHIGHGAVVHACTLQRNVLIGINAVVMDMAVIGESAIIAASAFVPAKTEIPPRTLAVGVPARVVRALSEEEMAWKLQATATYQQICRESRVSVVPCTPLSEPEPDRRRCKEPDVLPLSEFKRRIGAQ